MSKRRLRWVAVSVSAAAIVLSAASGVAANNSVPATRAGEAVVSISPNDLKPTECAGMTLTALMGASGTAGSAATLILGTDGADTVSGGGGNDCIVGGAGNDTLSGGNGNDMVLGGPGNDRLNGEGGNDVLYGQEGYDRMDGGSGTDECDWPTPFLEIILGSATSCES